MTFRPETEVRIGDETNAGAVATSNVTLVDLPRWVRDEIIRSSDERSFAPGDTILSPGEITRCHFIDSGLASLVFGQGCKHAVGVGLVGPRGCIGVRALFGIEATPHSVVAVTNCHTREISAAKLREVCKLSPELHATLRSFFHAQIAHTMSLAACNAQHRVEQRLARLLLAAADLLGGERLRFTHTQLAALLGVRRVTVTLALQKLEGEKGIRSRRGLVTIRERARLELNACTCHEYEPGAPDMRAETVGGPHWHNLELADLQ